MNPWTMLTCRWTARNLDAYLDRALEEDQRARLAQHLERCLRCQRSQRRAAAIRSALLSLRPSADRDALERLQTTVRDLAGSGS